MTPAIAMPDTSLLVVEDDTPVDSIYTEKQQRLLTEPLYQCPWTSPSNRSFLAMANVGLFFEYAVPPLVPDVMLSLNVPSVDNRRESDNRSYFCWIIGKVPDVVIEIVSDRRGGEDSTKMRKYADRLIPYYVVYDPDEHLDGGLLRAYALNDGEYETIDPRLMPEVGLGLKLWTGVYEGDTARWLRWCDADGKLIPTGPERTERQTQRADQQTQIALQERHLRKLETQRAEEQTRLAEQERQLAKREKQRAEEQTRLAVQQTQRAEEQTRLALEEKQRADTAEARIRRMAEQLRALGGNGE